MKKFFVFIIGFLLIVFAGIYIYRKNYFTSESIRVNQKPILEKASESRSGAIDLADKINLRWEIINFKSQNHHIEYCENTHQDARYICSIDHKEWFGSDFKMDLPKYELKSLTIYINGNSIRLEVSQMFNPNNSGELNKDQFKIKKYKDFYILYGFFSDGAGTYTAHWKIQNGKSERIIISNEDEDFEWQISN